MENIKNILFYSGNGNHPLGAKMLGYLNEYLGASCRFRHIDFSEFQDGESDARIPKFSEIRGKTIVFYQSIFNQELFEEALELIWAIKKQYGASYLIAVIPFLIFRRQDHEEKSEEICRLKMAIDRLKHAGVDEIITVSPHSSQMTNFCDEFGVKIQEIDPSPLYASAINTYLSTDFVIYSPDQGSITRAIRLAKLTSSEVIFSLKNRGLNNESEIKQGDEIEITGIIKHHSENGFSDIHYASAKQIGGQSIVMIEDEVSTGSTANRTGKLLKIMGAKNIIFLAAHPVLVRGWRRKLFDDNPFYKVIMGDTIPRDYEKRTGGLIHDISVAEPTAQALFRSLQPFT